MPPMRVRRISRPMAARKTCGSCSAGGTRDHKVLLISRPCRVRRMTSPSAMRCDQRKPISDPGPPAHLLRLWIGLPSLGVSSCDQTAISFHSAPENYARRRDTIGDKLLSRYAESPHPAMTLTPPLADVLRVLFGPDWRRRAPVVFDRSPRQIGRWCSVRECRTGQSGRSSGGPWRLLRTTSNGGGSKSAGQRRRRASVWQPSGKR